jgi:hypothetical protein
MIQNLKDKVSEQKKRIEYLNRSKKEMEESSERMKVRMCISCVGGKVLPLCTCIYEQIYRYFSNIIDIFLFVTHNLIGPFDFTEIVYVVLSIVAIYTYYIMSQGTPLRYYTDCLYF